MTHISGVINNQKDPIDYRIKPEELKPYRLLDSNVVDLLLQDYSDLIDTRYTPWFAKRFYNIPFDVIHSCASQARQDGKSKQRLFSHLINKASQ
jgi:hypothetical protein